jgi:putative transposase
LRERGIELAPLRRRRYSWATFIKAHLSGMAAADFFTVEMLSLLGLVRYHVLLVIDLATVEIAGISRCPEGLRMDQVARNLLDAGDGFLLGKEVPDPGSLPPVHEEVWRDVAAGGVIVIRLAAEQPKI